jgi:hypothetical protein
MMIQHSLQILTEISEIEEQITKVENLITSNKLDIDIEAFLIEIITKSEY